MWRQRVLGRRTNCEEGPVFKSEERCKEYRDATRKQISFVRITCRLEKDDKEKRRSFTSQATECETKLNLLWKQEPWKITRNKIAGVGPKCPGLYCSLPLWTALIDPSELICRRSWFQHCSAFDLENVFARLKHLKVKWLSCHCLILSLVAVLGVKLL